MLYCEAGHFSLEVLHLYDANVVRFKLTSGVQHWHIVGFYLSPDNVLIIEDIVEAIIQRPRGAALLVVGYFNTTWPR